MTRSSDGIATLVLRNGRVWTVDPRCPRTEAVAIRGNVIVAVGRNEEVEPLIGPGTRVIDLGGQLLLPGFHDAHTHWIWALLREHSGFSLYGVRTVAETQAIVSAFARQHPETEWLLGNRWDANRFEGGRWPTRAELDAVEPHRPVAIRDIDGHSAWVNSAALVRLGYTRETPDPLGGRILRDAHGEPTGILLENAHEALPAPPTPAPGAFRSLVREGAAALNRLGITSLCNNGLPPGCFDEIVRMAEEGALTVRLSEWPDLEGLDVAQAMRWRTARSERVRVVGLKAMVDGVLSAHTAWMLEPYSDAPEEAGFPLVEPETLFLQALRVDACGFQVILHTIGDRAVREALDILARVQERNGRRDSRHRLEHIEVAHPDDLPRFACRGVVASMMPQHATSHVDDYIRSRLGDIRGARSCPWRALLDHGVHLCFGTDWPAIDLARPDPLEQIYVAVTRATGPDHRGAPWHPEQALSVAEAIRCYTLEGAYAEFMEHRKGSITPGKLADLCALSRDILELPPESILETEVTLTIFDGEVVYRKE
ncbi:MAG: amidohydrolase [Chloroflexia bacterium]